MLELTLTYLRVVDAYPDCSLESGGAPLPFQISGKFFGPAREMGCAVRWPAAAVLWCPQGASPGAWDPGHRRVKSFLGVAFCQICRGSHRMVFHQFLGVEVRAWAGVVLLPEHQLLLVVIVLEISSF